MEEFLLKTCFCRGEGNFAFKADFDLKGKKQNNKPTGG